MSYGIVRVQKMKKGAVRGINIHDQRLGKKSNTNPDIDYDKSGLNYNLISEDNLSYQEKIRDVISGLNLKRAVRKDAILMCQVLVTSDHSFFEKIDSKQQKEFFQNSFEFLKDKYSNGTEDNIISAVVHLDEKTPHMHFNFVPVTDDGRLCAKDIFSPTKLGKLHDEFHQDIGKYWGLDRGEKGGNKKHIETAAYKEFTERNKDLVDQISDNKKTLKNVKLSVEIEQEHLSFIQKKNRELMDNMSNLDNLIKLKKESLDIEYLKELLVEMESEDEWEW